MRKAIERERRRRGHVADGRFRGGGAAFDAVEHPLQHAHVFAVARPQEFSVRALAEPIHMENLRRIFQLRAHRQPVAEIIGHVVAAEGKHGHRIAARDADGARGGGGGFRSHRRADENAVLPVPRFVDQRSKARAAPAENERGDGHALGIFPVFRKRGRLRGRHGVARVRMRRGAVSPASTARPSS